jgi:Tfp pilus assembly protein PilF
MSLINDMLKDLDARERSRSLPLVSGLFEAERGSRYVRRPWLDTTAVLQVVLTLVVAGVVAWWVSQQQAHPGLRTTHATSTATETPPVPVVLAVTKPEPIETAPPVAAMSEPVVVAPTLAVARLDEPKKPRTATPATKSTAPPRVTPPVVKTSPGAAPGNAQSAPAPVKVDTAQKAEQLYQQALAEQKQGVPEAAMKSLRASLDLLAQHAKARLMLAQLLVERKQNAAAAELLADGLMLLPQHTGFMLAIAPLWIQAGQQNDAMALLAQGAKSANNDPTFHAYYAAQLLRLKRPAEAVSNYRIALRSDANKSEWLLGLGLSLHGAGNVREAIEALRRASDSGGLSPQNKTMVEQVVAKLQTTAS